MPPWRCSMAATAAFTAGSSATSKGAVSARGIFAAAAVSAAASRALSTTLAPASAMASAMAKPSPRDAPVTRAIRPSSEKSPGIGVALLRFLVFGDRLAGVAERIDGGGHAGIDAGLKQHLADLLLADAVAQRALHVQLQLVRL